MELTGYEYFEWTPTDDASTQDILGLLRTVFPQPELKSEEWFRWKHEHSAYGPSIVTYARDDFGTVAAARAFWRTELRSNQRRFIAYQPCDTATSPQHRGQGLFAALTRKAIEIAGASNASLLFNFPTANARVAYQRLGWVPRLDVVALAKPLRPVRLFLRALRLSSTNGRLVPATVVNSQLPAVFPIGVGECHLMPFRPAGFNRWRFTNHPYFQYGAVHTESISAIYRLQWRHNCCEAVIVHLTARTPYPTHRHFSEIVEVLAFAEPVVDCVTTVTTSAHPYLSALRSAGFFFVPHDIHLQVFTSLGTEVLPASWRLCLSGADIDTY